MDTKIDDIKPNIFQRINAVMFEVYYVQKESKKVNNQFTFVSHDAVAKALHGPMAHNGIAMIPTIKEISQDGNRTVVKVSIDFVNIDEPMDRVTVEYWGYGIDQQDKGVGKAISYAVKYALLKVFCLETGDDIERDSIDYEPAKLSKDQIAQMELLLNGNLAIRERVLKWQGVDEVKDMLAANFDIVMKEVKKYVERKKNENA